MEKTVYYPGPTWGTPAQPHDAGWSAESLRQAERYAHSSGSVAVMVISRGAVIAAWGEIDRPFNVRSIRKSMVSALYGIHVDAGHILLSQTLDELGIDDQDPTLTANEKRATVADLLTSRSGVYHASNCQGQAERDNLPPRESHAPGTFWYYNNWDFNALDTIFEHAPTRVSSMNSSDTSHAPSTWKTSTLAWESYPAPLTRPIPAISSAYRRVIWRGLASSISITAAGARAKSCHSDG